MEQIMQGGSNRQYFRAVDETGNISGTVGQSYIHVVGTSAEENHAFIYMSRHFKAQGLNVPCLYHVGEDEMTYDQEDLGSEVLFDCIAEGRKTGVFCEKEKVLLRKTMRALARFQVLGARAFDWTVCYPQPEFNRRSVLWDLNYFKYCFLKATGVDFQEDRLENEFEKMADILLAAPITAFLYRDFQSRNVMIKDSEPYFIDYQGGRKGPIYYDVASFLWQAKANFHDDLREELIGEYLQELKNYLPVDENGFRTTLRHFVLFRTMQVLGAYGFRGYFEKKPHFLQSIPFAIENLRQLLKQDNSAYPYLSDVLQRMTEMKQFQDVGVKKPLVVRVFSFSYKKGIPADVSGNGGGFVFDCRAVNNPGKYDRYNGLTGMDEPVIRFIEDDGEMKPFLEAAYQLVDASVKRYMDRGFENLMVSFGCTGGQHRSVYGAEKMAQHLNSKFGVEVQIIHREQNIERKLRARVL
ncbi:MAG: phosphotransferase [Paludibacteraceae bacterium]|nr:phosphotransferase [Paludibacteraceae bacterium]